MTGRIRRPLAALAFASLVPGAPASGDVSEAGGLAQLSCTYSVSPTTISVPSLATTGSITVATGTSCSWAAVSAVSWITITGGASGTGIGAVTYSVAANPGPGSRTGTLTVAGQTVTVTQGTGSCTYGVTPTSISVISNGTTGTITVTTGASCGWTATSAVSWITITGGASGTGIGGVTYGVAANPGATSRTGTMTVAGRTVTVTQAAGQGISPPRNLRIVR